MNDHMYVAYSASELPGDRVTNVETDAVIADIHVYPFPTSELGILSSVREFDALKADVVVFPNPASDVARVRIMSVTNGPISVSVHTLQGEKMLSSVSPANAQDWTLEIPTGRFASGSYLIVIEQGGATTTRTLNVLH